MTPPRAGVYECAQCPQVFKDEATLRRRVWIFPGLGYLYVGRPLLAALDFLLEVRLLLVIVIDAAIGAHMLLHPPARPDLESYLLGFWLGWGFLVGIWALKRWLMLRHCRRFVREFIPVKA